MDDTRAAPQLRAAVVAVASDPPEALKRSLGGGKGATLEEKDATLREI
jgi:hypothetical protein